MGHYEERLEKDLDQIRKQVRLMGDTVENAVASSTRSVLTGDLELSAETILGDLVVNQQSRELDHMCHVFVARHLPSAGHLRYVSSVLRLSVALERIGDYAETISRTASQLSAPPPDSTARDLELMADQARRMLSQAMKAFNKADTGLAATSLGTALQLAPGFDRVFDGLVKEGETHGRPIVELFAMVATFNRLERVIHQAKNICEETIFAVTGKTKPEKVFDILFVDERNDGASLMAEHIARKAFPESGVYQSAGWNAATEVDTAVVTFAESKGIDMAEARPIPLPAIKDRLSDFNILVALSPEVRDQVGRLPFHTTLLTWDLRGVTSPEAIYKELSPRLRELTERLRGEAPS